jgi:hypothetical protein
MKLRLIFIVLILQIGLLKAQNTEKISPKLLHQDLDYAYKKLRKTQPKLYLYISKDSLEHKLQALKNDITTPLTSLEFYKKICPFFNSVRQGHLFVIPPIQVNKLSQQKPGKWPFQQLRLQLIDNKIYIASHTSIFDLPPLTSLEKVDGEDAIQILDRLKTRFTGDGYTTTYFDHFVTKAFGMLYYFDSGVERDTIRLTLRRNGEDSVYTFHKGTTDTIVHKINNQTDALFEKISLGDGNSQNNSGSLPEQKSLSLLKSDKSVAILRIRNFNAVTEDFYTQCFQQINQTNCKNLIIDLRNNSGGDLADADLLFSYLMNQPYRFMEDYEVASRAGFLDRNYFKGGNLISKITKTLIAPFYVPILYFKVYKKDGKFFTKNPSTKQNRKPNALHYDGKVYVLINGGSFSATTTFASSIKSRPNTVFVGQETGGSMDGYTGSIMPYRTLPNSKVNIVIGMAYVKTPNTSKELGRGVLPDFEIIPTVEDFKNGIDTELSFILKQIK